MLIKYVLTLYKTEAINNTVVAARTEWSNSVLISRVSGFYSAPWYPSAISRTPGPFAWATYLCGSRKVRLHSTTFFIG